jgi:hypothetical protein
VEKRSRDGALCGNDFCMNVSPAFLRARRLFLWLLLSSFILHPSSFPLLAADPSTFTVGAFTFKRPATWQWVAVNSSMRKAQLRVPDPTNPSGPGADVVFFHFGPGQGGGIDSNISRWLGQFTEAGDQLKPVIEKAEVKGTKVTRVRVAKGTFSSGMPGGPTTPMADYALYGAILESPQGDVFVKMTGPAELVNAAAANFEALIQSPF